MERALILCVLPLGGGKLELKQKLGRGLSKPTLSAESS